MHKDKRVESSRSAHILCACVIRGSLMPGPEECRQSLCGFSLASSTGVRCVHCGSFWWGTDSGPTVQESTGYCVMFLRDLEKESQSVDERVVLDCVSNLKETPWSQKLLLSVYINFLPGTCAVVPKCINTVRMSLSSRQIPYIAATIVLFVAGVLFFAFP